MELVVMYELRTRFSVLYLRRFIRYRLGLLSENPEKMFSIFGRFVCSQVHCLGMFEGRSHLELSLLAKVAAMANSR